MASANTLVIQLMFLVTGISGYARCPDPQQIYPCTCKEYIYPKTEFDCSKVTSNDQLAAIFNQNFAQSDFVRLLIEKNKGLTIIRPGDFGNCTFEEIRISGCHMEQIEPLAFASSYSKLRVLILVADGLEKYPFEEVPNFKVLQSLVFASNNISTFPEIKSDSITTLNFWNNSLRGPLPVDALQQLPALSDIIFQGCSLDTILPGTFTGLKGLRYVDISDTGITKLSSGTIAVYGNDSGVDISYNDFKSIEPKSFTGVESIAHAASCGLTVLEESIWKPVVANGALLIIPDNDFECGCDMAWLVLNSTYMSLVDRKTACADGTLFIALDPDDFIHCLNSTTTTTATTASTL